MDISDFRLQISDFRGQMTDYRLQGSGISSFVDLCGALGAGFGMGGDIIGGR